MSNPVENVSGSACLSQGGRSVTVLIITFLETMGPAIAMATWLQENIDTSV